MQSKVYRAHEALLDELDTYGYVRDETAKVTPPPATPAPDAAGANANANANANAHAGEKKEAN